MVDSLDTRVHEIANPKALENYLTVTDLFLLANIVVTVSVKRVACERSNLTVNGMEVPTQR
jgi:hypothetical protein